MTTTRRNGTTDNAQWIEGIIRAFIASPENNMGPGRLNERAWDTPLIGFARGDDPLWSELKKDIGDFYWTPLEIFTEDGQIILRKYEPACIFCGSAVEIKEYKGKKICRICRKAIGKGGTNGA